MKWIGTQTIYDHVRLNKGITLDSVSITTIQSSGESFADNDTSLMTSAAVDDRIAVTAAALITAEDLDVAADSGTAAVDLNSQSLTVTGGTNLTTSATGQAVTVNLDNPIAGPIEIEQGASGGGIALLIDNNDIDQHALKLEAANTTMAAMTIAVPDLTTGHAINVNADSLTTGSALRLDVDDALTTASTKSLLKVDYDKAGVTASGETSNTTGLDVNMADAATNNASGRVSMIGVQIDVDSANAQGTITQKGLVLNIAADGVGDVATTSGIEMEVIDGGADIKMMSHADTADYCTIATTTNGATTITTVDDGAAAAHFEVAADGDITLDAAGTIKLEGPVRSTGQTQVTNHVFVDNMGTTKHYIGLTEADAENTSTSNKFIPFPAITAGKLLKVALRSNKDLTGHDLTWRLESIGAANPNSATPDILGTQSGAGCNTTTMTTYDFTSSLDSGANAFDASDLVYLSIQSDTSFGSNVIYYITCVWEWDFSSIG